MGSGFVGMEVVKKIGGNKAKVKKVKQAEQRIYIAPGDKNGICAGGNSVIQCKTQIKYGRAKRISYKDYLGNIHFDVVGTETDAYLDPKEPLKGTETGGRTGIYEEYDLFQGHLLNAELGGRALGCNLFPLTESANINHAGIEGEVKNIYRSMDNGSEIHYIVEGRLNKCDFDSRDDYIENSMLLCTIERRKTNNGYIEECNRLFENFPVYNNDNIQVPDIKRRKARAAGESEAVSCSDKSGSSVEYASPVEIEYSFIGRTYSDTVSGGMHAHLNPMSGNLVGTEVGGKSGIYKHYGLVQGHMLNAALGGRSIGQNLFPISKELNKDHAGVEALVKKLYYNDNKCVDYDVNPKLEKLEFAGKNDFLRNSYIVCTIGTADGASYTVTLTNPVYADDVRDVPGVSGTEHIGRFDSEYLKQHVQQIQRLIACGDSSRYINDTFYAFRPFSRFPASERDLVADFKTKTFLLTDERAYSEKKEYNNMMEVSRYLLTVYCNTLNKIMSADSRDISSFFTVKGIAGTDIADMYPL